jgi:hypothetical protein
MSGASIGASLAAEARLTVSQILWQCPDAPLSLDVGYFNSGVSRSQSVQNLLWFLAGDDAQDTFWLTAAHFGFGI